MGLCAFALTTFASLFLASVSCFVPVKVKVKVENNKEKQGREGNLRCSILPFTWTGCRCQRTKQDKKEKENHTIPAMWSCKKIREIPCTFLLADCRDWLYGFCSL
jgi:hypothetical protein